MVAALARVAAVRGATFAMVTGMARRFLITLIVAVVTLVASSQSSRAGEFVTVQLASGRIIAGVIDARSDAKQLWLRRGDDEVSVTRLIEWTSIASAAQDDEPIDLDDLKTLAAKVAARPQVATPLIQQPKWRGVIAAPIAEDQPREEPLPPIRSLAIDAYHANWDADVESDGLIIVVYPLDSNGMIVPVNGTLEVELVAPEVRRFQDAPHGRGLTLERIGQWTAAVNADEFGPRGVRIQLPFQALNPEFESQILPQGLVHARLVVPGQGTFDTTADFVRLRPWSPLRDKLWRDTGRRFLPTERVSTPGR
jgi:hypothetical protein